MNVCFGIKKKIEKIEKHWTKTAKRKTKQKRSNLMKKIIIKYKFFQKWKALNKKRNYKLLDSRNNKETQSELESEIPTSTYYKNGKNTLLKA